MNYAEAAAAIGRRVKITSGKYVYWQGTIKDVTRKLVVVNLTSMGPCRVYLGEKRLAPYRLELINEEESQR